MARYTHVVMVSQYGLPTVVSIISLDYPLMVQSGLYQQITETPKPKKECDQIKEQMLQEFPDTNE